MGERIKSLLLKTADSSLNPSRIKSKIIKISIYSFFASLSAIKRTGVKHPPCAVDMWRLDLKP